MDGVPAQFDSPRDRAEFRRPAHRPGVELYRAHIVDCAFEPHSHDAYGIGVIDQGVERFRLRGTDHLAACGSLVAMQPQDLHTGRAETPQGWSYRMIYLDEALLRELSGGPAWRFDAAVFAQPSTVAAVGARLQALWHAAGQPEGALAVDGLLLDLVELLRPLARTGRPIEATSDQRFGAVLDFMRAHLDQPLTLDTLAGVAGLSPFHFLRSFRARHHATPQQMLMALRLLDAKRRLAAAEPVAQIAAAVGLTDQAHLTHAFARRYGVTPARYQQQLGTRPRRHA
jgi:AraC-like DNA-binding protein